MPLLKTFSFLSEVPTRALAEELQKRAEVEWVRIGGGNTVCFDQDGPALVLMVREEPDTDGQDSPAEVLERPWPEF